MALIGTCPVSELKTNMKILPGLEGLEVYVEYDTLIYILRELYKIINRSSQFKESKKRLEARICHFEKEASLPGFLSAIEIDELLLQLEDAQYIYPICRREIILPKFH